MGEWVGDHLQVSEPGRQVEMMGGINKAEKTNKPADLCECVNKFVLFCAFLFCSTASFCWA